MAFNVRSMHELDSSDSLLLDPRNEAPLEE